MNRIYKLLSILFFCLAISLSTNSFAGFEIAFGYLENVSSDQNYEYLEIIFPNSFASSISSTYTVDTVKPLELSERLKKKYNLELKKNYDQYELNELIKKCGSDLFIYGSFEPLPNDQIKMIINIYVASSKQIFTFTNIGRMETEIFKLVDRITAIVYDFFSYGNKYKQYPIKSNSNLAIITNLDGDELNVLYANFLKKKFDISAFQATSINNIVSNKDIEKFGYIQTKNNSYATISDWRKLNFYHGTWTNEKYIKHIYYEKEFFKKYDENFVATQEQILSQKLKETNSQADYLLIIGFSQDRKNAWIRCINLKSIDLVIMDSEINSKGESKDPIDNICNNIIISMSKEIEQPLPKND